MRKSDSSAQAAGRTGLRRTEAAGTVDAVLEAVTEALAGRKDLGVASQGVGELSRLKSVSNAQGA